VCRISTLDAEHPRLRAVLGLGRPPTDQKVGVRVPPSAPKTAGHRVRSQRKPLSSLKPYDFDDLYAALLDRGLLTRTVRICHTVLGQALEQARKWRLIARSPAIDASPPAQRHKEIIPPTVADVQRLLEAASGRGSGVRDVPVGLGRHRLPEGEGCALRWNDIEVDATELMIRRSLCPSARRWSRRRPRRERRGASPSTSGR